MASASDAGVVHQLLLPLKPYLSNSALYEVVINRPGEVLTESADGWTCHEIPELTFDRLLRLAKAIASFSNQTISEQYPLLSATLPDEERVQIVLPPATMSGSISFTIRKPSSVSLTLTQLEAEGLFGELAAPSSGSPAEDTLQKIYDRGAYREFLEAAVHARKNIIISGATGSGKTTLAKALIQHIPPEERVISIEDSPELVIPQPNHVRLLYSKGAQGLARVGPKDLLEASLRMRPDRIMLQELRDGSAFYFVRNVNTGHPGSITTVHADSANLALEQLTLLVKESEGGRQLDRADVRALLRNSIDVIAQCKRVGGKFRVTEIDFLGAGHVGARE